MTILLYITQCVVSNLKSRVHRMLGDLWEEKKKTQPISLFFSTKYFQLNATKRTKVGIIYDI